MPKQKDFRPVRLGVHLFERRDKTWSARFDDGTLITRDNEHQIMKEVFKEIGVLKVFRDMEEETKGITDEQ